MREYTYEWYPERYDDENEPILKITKSSFGSFQWCPKKYEFSYPLRMPQTTSEAMIKGTVVHNSREDFFNDFDIKKAENLSFTELVEYNMGLHPIDDYTEMYRTLSVFEAERFIQARENNTVHEYLPVINEILLDAEIFIPRDLNPKCVLERDYTVHLQGIIDRMFVQDGNYIPIELKTGAWKDYKLTSMRKELAFYKILIDAMSDEEKIAAGLDVDGEVTNWGWYYPASNYIQVEKVKKQSLTAVYRGITELIKAYERKQFNAKYYYKTCSHCSFYSICPTAQEQEFL
jgi:CRISPR/Cas system-associated exonuclease Cas4 (RecB family)|tara:strand:+ start:613 stop:1479 length:867 start_codon:yes stop_codon:yes gene_type:complete